jgi:hypothetical protein
MLLLLKLDVLGEIIRWWIRAVRINETTTTTTTTNNTTAATISTTTTASTTTITKKFNILSCK